MENQDNFQLTKNSERVIRYDVPNFRVQNKITEIIFTQNFDLLEERMLVPSAEGEKQVMRQLASGEINDEQLKDFLHHIKMPGHLFGYASPEEQAMFNGMRNTPETNSKIEYLLRLFVTPQPVLTGAEFFRDCRAVITKFPTPLDLEKAIKKFWQTQGLSETQQTESMVDLYPAMRYFYGKRQQYFEQMRLLQKSADERFPQESQERRLKSEIARIEQIADPETLKNLLEASYSVVFLTLKKNGVPLNHSLYFDPRFGEALRQQASLPALIKRIMELQGGFDNQEIEQIKQRALETVRGGMIKMEKSGILDENNSEVDSVRDHQKQMESFSWQEIPAIEGRKIAQRAVIHGDEINGEFLTNEHLIEAGLQPKYRIEIEGVKILLSSAPYQLRGGNRAVSAYVEKDGKLVVRSFYLSNSQGLWRYLPGFIYSQENQMIDWYGKGHDEVSVALPVVLQKVLSQISEQTSPLHVENPDLMFAGTSRVLVGETYRAEVNLLGEKLGGEFYPTVEQLRNHEKKSPETLTFFSPEQAPEFSKMLSTWEQESPLYGRVTYEVFPSRNQEFTYVFCRDNKGRAWIANIENNSAVSSLGVRRDWVDGGDLLTPAFEYHRQAGGYGNLELRGGRKGRYVDMFKNYLSKIPVIREYLKLVKSRERSEGESVISMPEFSLVAELSQAQNFEALYELLKKIKGINGSKDFYPSGRLIKMIEAVRQGELSINFLTNEAGLRSRVKDLLALEKVRSQE